MIMFADINYWAVIAAAILNIILGSLWYSPYLFGTTWMELMGLKPEDCKKEGVWSCFAGGFIVGLIASYVLALLVKWTNTHTAWDGAILGFLVWLGFIATTKYSKVI